MQQTIFDFLYPTYKITKPIRLIEFFSGIGAQAKALKNLNANFEHYKTCEWAIPSILAYNEIHHKELKDYGKDFAKDLTKEELIDYLFKKGISSNYNEPMKLDQVKRLPENKLRQIYNAIHSTNDLVNIQQVHGADLEIVNKMTYDYLLTYSFPCQDLSLAGTRAGYNRDSGTRSGMLWEVERILKECEKLCQLPQILLMENVPQVQGSGNVDNFVEWQRELEKLGYSNYFEILNAKDYGIPQNRERCFMVSILGQYNYSFPDKIPLKLKLKDMLEDQVDEKFYLSDKQIKDISNWNAYEKPLEHIDQDIVGTLTTRSGEYTSSMKLVSTPIKDEIKVIGNYTKSNHNASRIVDTDGIAPTVMENHGTITAIPTEMVGTYQFAKSDSFMGNQPRLKLGKEIADTLQTSQKEAVVLKRQLCNKLIEDGLVEEGDVVKHSYTSQIMEGNKKCVEKSDGVMITLTTRGDCVGVAVKDSIPIKNATKKGYLEAQDGDGIDISGRMEYHRGTVQKGISQTLSTAGGNNVGIVIKKNTENYIEWEEQGKLDIDCRAFKEDKVAPTTTTTNKSKVLLSNLRIRKLTGKECYRLMGFDDEDYDNAKKVLSENMIYHTSGDSIVVNVLMAIFSQMLDINWVEKWKKLSK